MAASPGASSGRGDRPSTLAAEAGWAPCAPASELPPMPDLGNFSSLLRSAMRTSCTSKLGLADPVGFGAAHRHASGRNGEGNDVTRLYHDVLADRSTPAPDGVRQESKRAGPSYQGTGDSE